MRAIPRSSEIVILDYKETAYCIYLKETTAYMRFFECIRRIVAILEINFNVFRRSRQSLNCHTFHKIQI